MNQTLKYLYDGLSGIPIQENPFTTTELEILLRELRDKLQMLPDSRETDDQLMIMMDIAQQVAFEAGFYAAAALYIK